MIGARVIFLAVAIFAAPVDARPKGASAQERLEARSATPKSRASTVSDETLKKISVAIGSKSSLMQLHPAKTDTTVDVLPGPDGTGDTAGGAATTEVAAGEKVADGGEGSPPDLDTAEMELSSAGTNGDTPRGEWGEDEPNEFHASRELIERDPLEKVAEVAVKEILDLKKEADVANTAANAAGAEYGKVQTVMEAVTGGVAETGKALAKIEARTGAKITEELGAIRNVAAREHDRVTAARNAKAVHPPKVLAQSWVEPDHVEKTGDKETAEGGEKPKPEGEAVATPPAAGTDGKP